MSGQGRLVVSGRVLSGPVKAGVSGQVLSCPVQSSRVKAGMSGRAMTGLVKTSHVKAGASSRVLSGRVRSRRVNAKTTEGRVRGFGCAPHLFNDLKRHIWCKSGMNSVTTVGMNEFTQKIIVPWMQVLHAHICNPDWDHNLVWELGRHPHLAD